MGTVILKGIIRIMEMERIRSKFFIIKKNDEHNKINISNIINVLTHSIYIGLQRGQYYTSE